MSLDGAGEKAGTCLVKQSLGPCRSISPRRCAIGATRTASWVRAKAAAEGSRAGAPVFPRGALAAALPFRLKRPLFHFQAFTYTDLHKHFITLNTIHRVHLFRIIIRTHLNLFSICPVITELFMVQCQK